ncbi:integrase arm-type DNA-binding domain-containing protein [Gammaproteobacteria bacterium]|nr:integrase arm-type DNA-binding domain-containing protein [Gammaproteobacteria bacterium]
MQKLTATAVTQARPKPKPYSLSDGGGMYLLVNATAKYWRYDYRFAGKRKTLALGVYPATSLKQAREKHQRARENLANGIDPSAHKKATSAATHAALANSFELLAIEWSKTRSKKSESTEKRQNALLEKDLLPHIGNRPIADIKAPELLKTLRKIENRGAIETAHRAKRLVGQIFRYAVATGRAERDPSVDLKDALTQPTKTHFKSITEPAEVGPLMAAITNYHATPVVMAALRLSPLLFCRPGELRHLEWSEVNFSETRIELPAAKMKIKEPHIIPLASQAVEILKELQPITGRGKYVFPSARGASRPLSENGVRTALRTLGYTNDQISPHGFRAMARTILDEVLDFPVDWIEHQLAHSVKDANGRAYNRTKHLPQRKKMMQTWADYLDGLLNGNNNILPFRRGQHG